MAPPGGNYWKVVLILSAFIAFAATQTSTDPSVSTIATDSPQTTAATTDPVARTDEATDLPGTTGKSTDPPQTTAETTDTLSTTNVPGNPQQTTREKTDPPLTTAVTTDAAITTDEVTDPAITTIKPTDPPLVTAATNEPGDLPDTPRPTLSTEGIWLLCASDYMLVEIPFDLFVAEEDYKDLVFEDQNDAECGGTNQTSQRNTSLSFAVFRTSLTDCGTNFTESADEHVYTNKITNRYSNGPISRQYEVNIPIACSYNRLERVSKTWYKLEDYILDTDLREEGEYKFDLQFFADDQYNSPIVGFPMVVHLNEKLYFQASSEYSHLDLSIQSCKATNGESYDATESYEFIENWEVAGGEDELTKVTCQNASFIDTLEVETRAFRFLEGDTDQVIYIHCDLYVCDRDDETSTCKEACTDDYTSQSLNRRRRMAGYAPPPLAVQRVTRGPIRIARDTKSSWVETDYHGDIQPSTSPLWGVAMLAMGSVVIVLLAALVLTLRKLGNVSSRGGGKTDEEETVGLMGI